MPQVLADEEEADDLAEAQAAPSALASQAAPRSTVTPEVAGILRAEAEREAGVDLAPGDTRRNVVTTGIDLPALVGRWFTVGDVLLFGSKRCPPCRHLELLTGHRLVKALAARGGGQALPVRTLTDIGPALSRLLG